ncbi:MAG: isochorismatase family protein [Pseudomonadota bacterium]
MTDLERKALHLGDTPGLLLIDTINAFTDPNSALGSECNTLVNVCAQLLTAFRLRGFPVLFTTVVYTNTTEAPVFRTRLPALNMLNAGSWAVEVDDRLRPRPHEPIIEKQYASAFFRTDLAAQLLERHVDSLVVVGLTTSGCIRASVVDALQHDYPVWVPREAVGDRNHAAHEANLHDMHAKYADVVSVADVLGQLERHPGALSA